MRATRQILPRAVAAAASRRRWIWSHLRAVEGRSSKGPRSLATIAVVHGSRRSPSARRRSTSKARAWSARQSRRRFRVSSRPRIAREQSPPGRGAPWNQSPRGPLCGCGSRYSAYRGLDQRDGFAFVDARHSGARLTACCRRAEHSCGKRNARHGSEPRGALHPDLVTSRERS